MPIVPNSEFKRREIPWPDKTTTFVVEEVPSEVAYNALMKSLGGEETESREDLDKKIDAFLYGEFPLNIPFDVLLAVLNDMRYEAMMPPAFEKNYDDMMQPTEQPAQVAEEQYPRSMH